MISMYKIPTEKGPNPMRAFFENITIGAAAILLGTKVILLIIVSPLAVIWAINTLFNTTITYNVINWLVMLILLLVVLPKNSSPSNKSNNDD